MTISKTVKLGLIQEELKEEILGQAIYSKTADETFGYSTRTTIEPIKIVFHNGIPIPYRTFCIFILNAVASSTCRLTPREKETLCYEQQAFCTALDLNVLGITNFSKLEGILNSTKTEKGPISIKLLSDLLTKIDNDMVTGE